MRKNVLTVCGVVVFSTGVAFAANPTYKWVGTAAAGNWSDSANWLNVETQVHEVPVVGGMSNAMATWLDFTDLPANATVTFDSSVKYCLGNLTFGANKGAQTFVMDPNAAGFINYFSTLTITVPTGTAVSFGIDKPQTNNDYLPTMTFAGGGTFTWTAAKLSAHRWNWKIADSTVVEIASPAADLQNLFLGFTSATALFRLQSDVRIGAIITSSETLPGQIDLNGYNLEFTAGNGSYATSGATSFAKSAKCKVYTPVSGEGTVAYSGAATVTNMVSQPFSGTLRILNSDVVMAPGATFSYDSDMVDLELDVASSGRLTLSEDQTFKTLRGDGTTGGVKIESGATLTAGCGSYGATTFNGTLSGDGDFVKTGSDELVLNGANTLAGATRIEGGTLTVNGDVSRAAAESALLHAFRFEDELANDKASGTAATFSYRVNEADVSEPPAGATASGFCTGHRGTRGVELHAGAFASVSVPNGGTSGTGAFTTTFWMIPAWNICDSAINYNMTMLQFLGSGNGKAYAAAKIYLVKGTNLVYSVGAYTVDVSAKKDGLGIDVPLEHDRLYDGNWHMVTMTYSGEETKTLTAYFDGECVGSKVVDTGTLTLNGRCQLGWGDLGSLAGKFDDWKYLTRCQSAAEIKGEYLGEVADGDDFAALPAPVAKWTFDDAANPGKDTSGNGYDLVAPADASAASVELDGACGKALASESVLVWADTANPAAKMPSGGVAWTLSARFQVGEIKAGGNDNDPSVFYWGDPRYYETKAIDADKRYFSAVIRNDDGYRYYRAGFKINQSAYLTPTATMDDINYSGHAGRAAWTHVVYVYRPGDGYYMYQDGRYVSFYSCSTMNILPKEIVIGRRAQFDGNWNPVKFVGNIDDIRVFDQALTAEQVRTLTRGLETGRLPSALSAASDVTIGETAELKVQGTGLAAKSVSGAGTLNLTAGSSLSVGGGAMTGELKGLGQLSLTAPFKAATAADFYGNVVLSGTGAIDAPGLTATVALPDPYAATLASTAALPLVRTAGKVVFPAEGTLAFASKPAVGTYLVASATYLDLPATLDGWTVEGDGTYTGRFFVDGGALRLEIRAIRPMVLLVR